MRIPGSALIVLLAIGAVSLSALPSSSAQTPSTTLPTDRVFAADAGLIFNPIRPDKVADFEMVIGRLHEALSRSTDASRRKQAAGWKVYKATEPGPNGSVLYVFAMDPAVPGADYTVSKILSEAFPDETRDLYRIYTAAFAGSPSLVNLKLSDHLGAPYVPKPTPTPK